MKNQENTQNAKVVLTTKKSKELKGTKDVYLIHFGGRTECIATNVECLMFDERLPYGSYGLTQGVLFMSPTGVIVDTLHTIKEVSIDELSAEDRGALENTLEVNTRTSSRSVLEEITKDLQKREAERVERTKNQNTEPLVEKLLRIKKEYEEGKLSMSDVVKQMPFEEFVEASKELSQVTGDKFYVGAADTLEMLTGLLSKLKGSKDAK